MRPTIDFFYTFVHSPKQFLLSDNTEKWAWTYQSKLTNYKMLFRVRGLDIVRRRDKKQQPCNANWNEYDGLISNLHKNDTGCYNPYQERDENMPACNTQEQMIRSMFTTNVVKRRKYMKPCKTMENVKWEYLEYRSKYTPGNNYGDFWFSIDFPLNTFKEITQVR